MPDVILYNIRQFSVNRGFGEASECYVVGNGPRPVPLVAHVDGGCGFPTERNATAGVPYEPRTLFFARLMDRMIQTTRTAAAGAIRIVIPVRAACQP